MVLEKVKAILADSNDRTAVWSVNTEQEYHEEESNDEVEVD